AWFLSYTGAFQKSLAIFLSPFRFIIHYMFKPRHLSILLLKSKKTFVMCETKVFLSIAWQRPTLAGARAPTTMGAGELNYCVRHGNRCDLSAIATRLTGCHSILDRN